MRYTKKLGLIVSAIVLGMVFMAADASAQIRVGVRLGGGFYRPHRVNRYYAPAPYPYGYGYYGAPYVRPRSERYYDRQSLNSAQRHLNKDAEKYYSDGYITPHEQENLAKDRDKIERDRRRLHNDW